MPIVNTLTKETMTVEQYRKRIELEDYWGLPRGELREWSVERIEAEYYKEFLAD